MTQCASTQPEGSSYAPKAGLGLAGATAKPVSEITLVLLPKKLRTSYLDILLTHLGPEKRRSILIFRSTKVRDYRTLAWNGQLLAERRAPPQAERPTAGVTANGGGTRQWMNGAGGVAGLADHTGQGYTRSELVTRWSLGNRRFAHRPYEAVVAIMCDLVHAPTTELRIFAAGTHVDICQIPPLQARWEVIKTHQLNRTAWMDAVSFLAGEIDALSHPAHMMLGEILAIYLVLTCGSNFPLRVYLAIWRRGPLGVAALSQAAFDAQVVQSEVTARALQQSVCAAWAISFPLSQEYRSGEGVVSVEDYAQVYVAALERRQVIYPPKASSATTMGRHVAEARDGTGRRGRFEAPRRDGAGIDTQNICSKCGRHGHRSYACQHPIHPQYDARDPYKLVAMIGRGEIPVTN
jgi:hypothetical protein